MPGGELPLKNDEYMNNGADMPAENDIEQEALGTETVASEDGVYTENAPEDDTALSTPYDAENYVPDDDALLARLEGTDDSELDESPEVEEDTADGDAEVSESESEGTEKSASCNAASKAEPKKVEKPRRVDSVFDFVELFVFTLAAVFIITSFFFRYSIVDGPSMMNTLQDEQKLLLTNFFYEPKPGDVVVIDDRTLENPIVKRVIAIEGQTIRFTRTGVWINGQLLDEDYVFIDKPGYQYSIEPCQAFVEDEKYNLQTGEGYYEITVPENEIFVMGDHRNNSKDSRSTGTYHEDAVLGKAILRFAPFDEFGKID